MRLAFYAVVSHHGPFSGMWFIDIVGEMTRWVWLDH